MFYYLNGKLAYKDLTSCVIDCGGVGYKLTISQLTSDSLAAKLDKEVRLFTHLAVREDGVELFGFGTDEERECFNKLTGVSGIGPKVAMSILSTMTPEKLAIAITTEDVKLISKTPGIGAKTAARIVLELRDKISKDMLAISSGALKLNTPPTVLASPNLSEAMEALLVLGYDKPSITRALAEIDSKSDVGDIIRLALKKLAR